MTPCLREIPLSRSVDLCQRLALLALLGGALVGLGCQEPSADPALVAQLRKTLLLAEEPDEAQAVAEVREALLGTPLEADSHAHDDHAHDDHAHDDHAHDDHAHGEHAHDEHAHEDHADGEPAHTEPAHTEPAHTEPAHDDHAHEDHAHEDHAHDDHAHDDHAHEDHAHEDHAHDDHAHEDHAHGDHAHGDPITSDRELDVTMVGSVGGLPNPAKQSYPDFPFDKRKAIVFLADPAAVALQADEGHQHAPGEECAFCAAHAEDSSAMLAVVRFYDEKGRVAGVDVRELFDLQGMETVVVQGKAKIEAGMLVVDAKGLYVRR